jgi:signal transduction histidine kinase
VYDGQIYGALLLGKKKRQIFWPDELSTLQTASAQVAVAVRNNSLLQQTRELKTLDEYKTDLISDIAHEFKSPLAVMCDAMDILLQDAQNGKIKKEKLENYLQMMRRNAERLESFILNLLAAARIQRSKVELTTSEANLAEIVHQVIRLHEPLVNKKGLTLTFLSEKAIPVNVDVDKMHQVFSNLISNAVKFTETGSITIEVREENGRATVSIRDTGRGIDPKHLPSIFDRFFQANPALRQKGTGLGLAIAKGWTEAHGGCVRATSAGLNQGATFIVELPASGVAKAA